MKSKSILVPVDFSSHQAVVIEQAALLATRQEAEIVLLHCAAPPEVSLIAVEPVYLPEVVLNRFTSDHMAAATRKLEELAEDLNRNHRRVRTIVKATTAVHGILTVAQDTHSNYIVMGSHGAGFDRFLLGSVAESVSREATCPVVVVRSEEASPFNRAIVGIDFSPFSAPLIALARELVASDGEIHLLHCWQPPHLDTAHLFGDPGHESLFAALSDGMQDHSAQLERFVAQAPDDPRYQLHVETGRPAATLLKAADEMKADAIFVGAHDSEGLENFLGSVSDRVIRHAGTSVLLTDQARIAASR